MERLTFVTSNQGKVASLRRVFEDVGLSIAIDTSDVELIEPQTDTCEAVAVSKAAQAYEKLCRPLIVDDSAFHIDAFDGFPGPYAKYVIGKLGAEGFVALMKGEKNRAAYFSGVLVYVDASGKQRIFTEEPYRGSIADRVHTMSAERAWSELDTIFIPAGSDRVLGEMTLAERGDSKGNNGKYRALAEWLLKQEPLNQPGL